MRAILLRGRARRVCGFSLSCVAWCDLDLVASGALRRVNGMMWRSGGCVWSSGSSGHTVISQLARMSELLRKELRNSYAISRGGDVQ